MRSKLIITILVVIVAAGFYSFKNIGEKESSNIALVNTVFGKKESEGFVITYGDGTMELRQFDLGSSNENHFQGLLKVSVIMNELHDKGYHFVGNGSHAINKYSQSIQYMVFEKK